MAQPFSVRCPNCEARLKIQNPKAVGKKVRCPNCENPFTVRPPRAAAPPPEDDFDLEDDYDDFGDSYDDYDDYAAGDDYGPPRRSSRRGAGRRPPQPGGRGARRGKKRSKKKSANNQVALIVGGIVMAFLLLVGLGFFLYQLAGGGGAKVDYAWLPPDSEMIVSVDVDEVWNSNLARRLKNLDAAGFKKGLDEMQSELQEAGFAEGESIDAIDSVTAGFTDADANKGLAVIRKKTPWDIEAIKKKNHLEEGTHDGKTYYTTFREAHYFPDEKTMIIGDKEAVEQAMVRGPASEVGKRFSFMPKGDVVIAILPENIDRLLPSGPARAIVQEADKLKGGAMSVNVGSGVDLELLAICNDGAMAAELDKTIRDGIAEGRKKLSEQRNQFEKMMEMNLQAKAKASQLMGLFDEGEKILNSISSSQSGDHVTVSLEFSASLFDQIEDLAKKAESGGGGFNPFDFRKLLGGMGNRGPGRGPGIGQGPRNRNADGLGNPFAQATQARDRSKDKNNLKQIGLAMHRYQGVHGSFPVWKNPQNPAGNQLSWRVHILPFLEQAPLYQQFKLNEPWNSPHNMRLINQMPDIYRRPGSTAGPGKTNYLGVDGPGGVMENGGGTKFGNISDGLSNTALVVEVEDHAAVTWTKPEDYRYSPNDPKQNLGGWDGGFHILFCDGAVMFISEHFNPQELLKMFQMNDGERLNLF